MKKVISGMTALFVTVMMVSCSNGQSKSEGDNKSKSESTSASVSIAENVNVEEFAKHMDGAQLLDVRTPDEWSAGIIEGATMANIYDADFEANLAKLDKEKPVTVYCKSGGRSGQAMAKMQELGFKEVYNLKGGMGAWQGADKPTVKP
ncbi:MAG: rhodanese-like domain-containing protein [Flavobacteriales bacterium]|nr:rhodanese-like domain-containing protein [Flavobacteriales bacterium]